MRPWVNSGKTHFIWVCFSSWCQTGASFWSVNKETKRRSYDDLDANKWLIRFTAEFHHFLLATTTPPLSIKKSLRFRFSRCDQTLTNTVGLGCFGDSSSTLRPTRLTCACPAPALPAPVFSTPKEVSPCLASMLIRTCFIAANSWRITEDMTGCDERKKWKPRGI